MKSKKNRRSSMTFGEKMIFFAGVLFCLVLITTAMMGGLFARYTTIGSGSDSARVASWGQLTLTESGDFGSDGSVTPKIIPGVDLKKDVRISFTGSEMATYVFVEMKVSEHWTTSDNAEFKTGNNKISCKVLTGEDQWTFLKKENNSYIYYKSLQPNKALESNPFFAENGKIAVSSYLTAADMAYMDNMDDMDLIEQLFISVQASVKG